MLKMVSLVVGAGGGELDVKLYVCNTVPLTRTRSRLTSLIVPSRLTFAFGGSYLLIFLKFIQSIIPNIEYDYTGEFKIMHK